MRTLDLFSGIAGNTLALHGISNTIAYCEADLHARSVLLSRMADGLIPTAPIFPDVNTLKGSDVGEVDMIVGGFPCQDISLAGKGAGIAEGTRSGLFYQIMRLTDELKPRFLFLENVPAIRKRGLDIVLRELTQRRYDCRWTMLSAAEVGARHKRQRWFLMAYSNERGLQTTRTKLEATRLAGEGWKCGGTTQSSVGGMVDGFSNGLVEGLPDYIRAGYWEEEPCERVTQEREQRVERIKRLGNAVVPLQARTAFMRLGGL
jgi:DNA (cytosine-5)-methyltransferase 1